MEEFIVGTEAIHGFEVEVVLCVSIDKWADEPENGIRAGWDYDGDPEIYIELPGGITHRFTDRMASLIFEAEKEHLDGLVADKLNEDFAEDRY